MKPMLASHAEILRFPLLASPKLDGIRGYVENGTLLSRSGKPIRNMYVQKQLGRSVFEGLDGELAVGDPWNKNLMQKTNSGVMSTGGQPLFTYWVFDIWSMGLQPYSHRYKTLAGALDGTSEWAALAAVKGIKLLEHVVIDDQEQLDHYEEKCLLQGYEGVMVRDPNGPYKQGKSTAKEGWLLKVKRWTDGEARIVDFQEKMHNANELEQDAFGYAKRSSHQENKIPMNTLGALICEDVVTGAQVKVGTGFDDMLRKLIWSDKAGHKGKLVKYKHFEQTGVKDKRRFSVFLGFRDPEDMS